MRELLPSRYRYRCRRGRVMHRVYRVTGGGTVDLESMCREKHPFNAVLTHPRASGPEEDWSNERLWYEDCKRCPAERENENV